MKRTSQPNPRAWIPTLLLVLLVSFGLVGALPAQTNMALVPAGAFRMGDPLDGNANEQPVHEVYVSAFYMDKYEVTKALWDEVRAWGLANGYADLPTGEGKAANHPVHTINWYAVVKWCNARSEKEGLTPAYYTDATQTTVYRTGNINLENTFVMWNANGYRLPTEAEWEKAARGGLSGKRFPWGNTISHSQANYYAQPGSPAYDVSSTTGNHPTWGTGSTPYTSPAGAFPANDYGLHDMAGNLWQWCWDYYDGNWYANSQAIQDNPRGPAGVSDRVLRGGVWNGGADATRCACRSYYGPDHWSGGIGFRCVIVPLLITQHPQNAFALLGGTITFAVTAESSTPLAYQWLFNTTNLLSGQTNSTLVISNVQPANVGVYSVIVSSESGSLTSSNAFLTIVSSGVDDDGDGLSNELEIQWGTDPLNPDTDGDGLSDYDELFLHGTNPLLADTDGDGMPDGWEIQHGLNPRFNDATDDLDGDGLSNLAEYEWNLAHADALDPRNKFSTSATRSDFAVVTGAGTNRFYYDRTDRLVGAEYDRGLSLAYVYDGNGNLTRQVALRHDANANGLPDLWEFLNGLTHNVSAHTDTDGDGWTDWQEWKAGSDPRDAQSTPNLLGNPGTLIASLQHSFTPSNFVVGVGQLDGVGAEEIVLGADGAPGTNVNHLLVLTQSPVGWQTQRVDVDAFGITSIAVGQVTNRPGPGIYVGLRGATNGSGRVLEFLNSGGGWQSNIVALATNEAAFVLGVRGQDVLVSLGTSNAPSGSLSSVSFSDAWNLLLMDASPSHRGLGTIAGVTPGNLASLRLLDEGGIQSGGFQHEEGLVASYPFDGNGLDLSGRGNLATLFGAIPTTNRFGSPSSALSFTGDTNSYAIVNTFTDFPTSEITVTFWLRTSDTTRDGGIVSYAVPDRDNEFLLITPRNLEVLIRAVQKFSGVSVADGNWHHVTVTWRNSDGQCLLYKNGALAFSHNFGSSPPLQGSGTLVIAQDQDVMGGAFEPTQSLLGALDDMRIYSRVLTGAEITNQYSAPAVTPLLWFAEPAESRAANWRGVSLTSGQLRGMDDVSVFYTFVDDKNGNEAVDAGDDLVTAEYLMGTTNTTLLTLSRQPISTLNPAQSYGLASVNFLNTSNEVFFTGEPDGQVFAWTATGATNPLQRQLFSAHHAGNGWHALAGVKTLTAGEGLLGLRVSPSAPHRCDVILWPPQTELPQLAALPNTAPVAAVLPSAGTLGGQAALTVRLWDAEGNAATPFLQFQLSGATNWQPATLTHLNGGAYSAGVRVPALPGGVNHAVVWNALADLGANMVTNVLLRARAQDFNLAGNWSAGTPFAVNTGFPGNIGNEPAFGPAARLGDGRFQLTVTGGQLGGSYVLLASTNLADWTPIHGYVFTNPPVTIIDPDAANFRWRFYRIGPAEVSPSPTLGWSALGTDAGGGLRLWLNAMPGSSHRIEVSTDLVHWSTLTNLSDVPSPILIQDPAATNHDRRFYRAVRP